MPFLNEHCDGDSHADKYATVRVLRRAPVQVMRTFFASKASSRCDLFLSIPASHCFKLTTLTH